MRKELKILILANLSLLSFILYYTFDLLSMCIDDTANYSLTDKEINVSSTEDESKLIIPKIIHQTYKTDKIPEVWIEGQKKCIDLHPDYKYILWTDEMIHEFIAKEYSWFLPIFENYPYPIERADAMRYFVLYHFGGIYIDLDDNCERRLDPLLKFSAVVRKTSPTGISNDVMGSVPGHPFFKKLIDSLKHYNKNWFISYMTVMGSTGPIFVSIVWKQYLRWTKINDSNTVRILEPKDYKKSSHSFFSISKGSSWHNDDAPFMKSLENHILSCVVIGFVFGFWLLYSEYCLYCWLCSTSPQLLKKNIIQNFNNVINLIKTLHHKIFSNDYDLINATDLDIENGLAIDNELNSLNSDGTTKRTNKIMFESNTKFNNKKKKQNRSRKDSNLTTIDNTNLLNIEKNDPNYTDLS